MNQKKINKISEKILLNIDPEIKHQVYEANKSFWIDNANSLAKQTDPSIIVNNPKYNIVFIYLSAVTKILGLFKFTYDDKNLYELLKRTLRACILYGNAFVTKIDNEWKVFVCSEYKENEYWYTLKCAEEIDGLFFNSKIRNLTDFERPTNKHILDLDKEQTVNFYIRDTMDPLFIWYKFFAEVERTLLTLTLYTTTNYSSNKIAFTFLGDDDVSGVRKTIKDINNPDINALVYNASKIQESGTFDNYNFQQGNLAAIDLFSKCADIWNSYLGVGSSAVKGGDRTTLSESFEDNMESTSIREEYFQNLYYSFDEFNKKFKTKNKINRRYPIYDEELQSQILAQSTGNNMNNLAKEQQDNKDLRTSDEKSFFKK